MSTSPARSPAGQVIQTWLSPALAEQLKAQADLEHRTVSATVRLAIEDRLSRSDTSGPREAAQ